MQIECTIDLHETLLVPVLMYGSKTMLWKEMERSKIRGLRMDNLRGLLVIRRMEIVPNARIRVVWSDKGSIGCIGLRTGCM